MFCDKKKWNEIISLYSLHEVGGFLKGDREAEVRATISKGNGVMVSCK